MENDNDVGVEADTKKEEKSDILLRDRHLKFFKQLINLMPEMYQRIDSSRLTILYFALSGTSPINGRHLMCRT